MEKVIELLIHKAYQHYSNLYYDRLRYTILSGKENLIQILDTAIKPSFWKFAGWKFDLDNYGSKTSQLIDLGDNSFTYQHQIYLNKCFWLNFLGYQNSTKLAQKFTFPQLIKTLAHEIAHCLILEFHQAKLDQEHNEFHSQISQQIEEYLWTIPLCQVWQKKTEELK
jgi:hypothetical protein